ncbi:MAG: oligosaccharide flippase family protein [Candidatus Aminicenantes bacterium]|nr:oligosaccharide flippase family protein [Candidatus Aminicenantes bacterium]
MNLGKSRKVIANSIYNNIGYFWALIVSILLTAFIIHKLGIELFGIWILLEVMISFLSLLDFTGIGGAFVKYISEYHAKKDYENCSRVINLGWAYYTFFWIIVACFVLIFKKNILSLFDFPANSTSSLSFVFMGILLISFIRGSFAVFRSVLLGLQRMDITNSISILTSLVNAVGIIIFLNLGFELKGLVISGLITAFLTSVLQTIFAFRILPQMKFRPFSFDKIIFKKTFAYGVNIRIASIAELINTQIDKILLGLFLNTSFVGFYELGAKIAKIARSFPEQLLPAILPASSELSALDDKDNLQKLYFRGSKSICLLAFPIVFFIISNASFILVFWLGNTDFQQSALALQILSIGYTFVLLVSMGRLIARGMGIPKYEMRSSVLMAVLNIILSVVLIIKLGFIGALLGTTISGFLGSIYFIYMFHRYIKESLFSMIRKIYFHPLIFCAISTAASLSINYLLKEFLLKDPSNRIEALYFLLINGIVFLGIYILFLYKSRYIDKYDREILSGTLEFLKTFTRRKT